MKVLWSFVVVIGIVCCLFSTPINGYSCTFSRSLRLHRKFSFITNGYHRHRFFASTAVSDESDATDLLDILIEETVEASLDDGTIPIVLSETLASAAAPSTSTLTASTTEVVSDAEVVYHPSGTSYCICSQCKTAYLMDPTILTFKGLRVQCQVCDKDWFQTPDRLMKTDEYHFLTKMSDGKVAQVKKIIAEKNFPKYPRVDKVGVFIGNLPYTYTEKEIGDLFGEYGLTNIALVKDADQQSKGYGFLECSNLKDAQRLVNEMHHFYTEPNRKLTCRLANNEGGSSIRGTGDRTAGTTGGGGGGGGQNYSRGGGSAGPGGSGRPYTGPPSRQGSAPSGAPIKSWSRKVDN